MSTPQDEPTTGRSAGEGGTTADQMHPDDRRPSGYGDPGGVDTAAADEIDEGDDDEGAGGGEATPAG